MTTIRTLLASLPSLIAGLALVDLFYPGRRPSDWLLKLFMGFGLGLGITSCLDFFWMLLFSPTNFGYRWAEVALAFGLVGGAYFRSRKSRLAIIHKENIHWPSWPTAIMAGLLLAGGLLTLYVLWNDASLLPYGNFDSYATWNLRARALMLSGPQTWTVAFSPLLSWKSHVDYPLFWSLTLLRAWQELGVQLPQAGQIQTVGFGLASAGLLFSALFRFRGLAQGVLGTILVLGMPWFLAYNTFQQADGPLAFFYLLAVLLLYTYEQNDHSGVLILAGLSAGLAAWVKNDGLVFLVAVGIYLLVHRLRHPWGKNLARLLPFVAGLLLPLITILVFKIRLDVHGDLIGDQNLTQLLTKATDPSRWGTILATITTALPGLGGWSWPLAAAIPLYGLLAGRAPGVNSFWLWLVLVITLIGYIGVYLITPHDLSWQLTYSLSRLLFNLLLPAIFLVFVLANNPGQIISGRQGGNI
jgi:hypothetical protein